MKHRTIVARLAIAASSVVILGLGATVLLTWSRTKTEVVGLELEEADAQLLRDLNLARALFDQRVPGPWRLVPAPAGGGLVSIYNGNGRKDVYRATEVLTEDLYKGDTPLSRQRRRGQRAARHRQPHRCRAHDRAASARWVIDRFDRRRGDERPRPAVGHHRHPI